MKNVFFVFGLLFLILICSPVVNAKEVNVIQNQKLRAALLMNSEIIDSNYDGIITQKEASSFNGNLYLSNKGLTSSDISELSYFKNATAIMLDQNNITDISMFLDFSKLETLTISANPFDCSSLRNFTKCSQISALESKGIIVNAGSIMIDYDKSELANALYHYKVLMTVVRDIDTDVLLDNGETRHIEYSMSDLDVELIREWIRLYEMYIEKMTNYRIDFDVEIYETQGTVDVLPNNGSSEHGSEFSLTPSDVDEISDIFLDYDTTFIIAYSDYDTHSFGGVAGFDGQTDRGHVYIPYDTFMYGAFHNVLSDIVGSGDNATINKILQLANKNTMNEFYDSMNDRDSYPGRGIEAVIRYLGENRFAPYLQREINDLRKNVVINSDVNSLLHEFSHTVEQYSEFLGYKTWEFHDALRAGQEIPGVTINTADHYDYTALYLNGQSKPEDSDYKGIRDEIWSDPMTVHFSTTVTKPSTSSLEINVDDEEEMSSLSWTEGSNVTVYKLLRSTSSDGIYDVIYFGDETSYEDTDMTPGVTYYYKVVSINTSDNESVRSDASNVVTGKVTIKEVTDAPKVTITNTNNSLKLSWNDVERANSYTVYRSTSSTSNYKAIASNITALSYTDKGLTYGVTYYYKVKASNGISSKISNIISKKVIPNTVTNVTVKSGNQKIVLSWNKVSVTGYEIYRSLDNKTFTKIATITSPSTLTYTNSSLSINKLYYYKVRAYKTVSGSKVYGLFSSVVKGRTAPKAPTIALKAKSYNTMSVTVNSVLGASKYQIYRSTSKTSGYTKVGELTAAGVYQDSTVTPTITYYYKVRACNTYSACGVFSAVSSNKTYLGKPVVTTTTDASSANFTWKKVNGATGYQIFRSTSKTGSYTKVGYTRELSYKNSNLVPGKTYYYKLRSYILVNSKYYYSNYTNVIAVTPKIKKVSNLNVTTDENGLKLTWGKLNGITKYQVYRADSLSGAYTRITVIDTNSYIDESVQNDKTYYYKVRAYVKQDTKVYYGSFSDIKSLKYVQE